MRLTKLAVLLLFSWAMALHGFGLAGPGVVQDETAPVELKIPLTQTVFIPCLGEEVRLGGDVQAQFRVKADAGGDPQIEADFDFGGIIGAGLPSENQYRADGTSHFDSSNPSPRGFTFVSNFALNRKNSEESLVAHVKFHITVDKKGKPSVVVREVSIDC